MAKDERKGETGAVKDAAAKLAAENPPTGDAQATQSPMTEPQAATIQMEQYQTLVDVLDGLKSELNTVRADNKAMKAEIAKLKTPVTPERKAAVRDLTATPTPLIAPKSFRVGLPHAPHGLVTIETAGVREIDWKDHAIEAYIDRLGISRLSNGKPNTDHQFECVETEATIAA